MQIIFEISREHPTLPIAEIRACLNTYKIKFDELYHDGTYIAKIYEKRKLKKVANRLAMSHSINELLGKNEEELLKNLREKNKSFKVEGGNLYVRKKIGKLLVEKKNLKVDLEEPDIIIKILDKFFCREIYKIDRSQFEKRRGSKRPFSIPTTMHPRLARAMINLSEIKENEVLLDPFCGTGGILIEAGLLGIKVIGIDIKRELIEGCKRNLEYYGIKNYELYNEDMRNVDIKVDAVVTDFPYGRASHLSDKMDKLYKEAIRKIAEYTDKAVVGLPSLKFIDYIEKYFIIKEIHPVRVHKSLIRFFYVLKL